jgi:predicted naringenin-chalcone synthase
MPLTILGVGTAVPNGKFDQHDAQKVAENLCCESRFQAEFIPGIYAGSGIERRYVCFGPQVIRDIVEGTKYSKSPFLPTGVKGDKGPTTRDRMDAYEREAPKLGIKASAEALSAAAVLPIEITHLVTVSCTGFAAPGFDWAIINDLGLSPNVERTRRFMGCHAALMARVASVCRERPIARSTLLGRTLQLALLLRMDIPVTTAIRRWRAALCRRADGWRSQASSLTAHASS